MKRYPAIDVAGVDPDLVAAAADDLAPTAIENRGDVTRVFFASADDRDVALRILSSSFPAVAVDVDDEDWARRSQKGLRAISIGRITIDPRPPIADPRSPIPSAQPPVPSPQSPAPSSQPPITLVIQPSMGFGTGHHATTRLCLAALQELGVAGKVVLDVGTGSGILAIAAARLGAARALGIDADADAIQSARENLALNPAARAVEFVVADLMSSQLPEADVVIANLTGALVIRSATTLQNAVRPGGMLIISGLLAHERDAVLMAMSDTGRTRAGAGWCQTPLWERKEDEWVALAVKR